MHGSSSSAASITIGAVFFSFSCASIEATEQRGNSFWNGIPKNGLMQPVPAVQGVYKFKPMADPDDVAASQLKIQGAQTKPGNLPPPRPDNVNIGRGDFVGKIDNRTINTSFKQIQSKFAKHAADFGVNGNYNNANAVKFNSALIEHINSPGVQIIQGTYRGSSVIHYINPSTGLNVMTTPSGQFISGWRLNANQLWNVLNRGSL